MSHDDLGLPHVEESSLNITADESDGLARRRHRRKQRVTRKKRARAHHWTRVRREG